MTIFVFHGKVQTVSSLWVIVFKWNLLVLFLLELLGINKLIISLFLLVSCQINNTEYIFSSMLRSQASPVPMWSVRIICVNHLHAVKGLMQPRVSQTDFLGINILEDLVQPERLASRLMGRIIGKLQTHKCGNDPKMTWTAMIPQGHFKSSRFVSCINCYSAAQTHLKRPGFLLGSHCMSSPQRVFVCFWQSRSQLSFRR